MTPHIPSASRRRREATLTIMRTKELAIARLNAEYPGANFSLPTPSVRTLVSDNKEFEIVTSDAESTLDEILCAYSDERTALLGVIYSSAN